MKEAKLILQKYVKSALKNLETIIYLSSFRGDFISKEEIKRQLVIEILSFILKFLTLLLLLYITIKIFYLLYWNFCERLLRVTVIVYRCSLHVLKSFRTGFRTQKRSKSNDFSKNSSPKKPSPEGYLSKEEEKEESKEPYPKDFLYQDYKLGEKVDELEDQILNRRILEARFDRTLNEHDLGIKRTERGLEGAINKMYQSAKGGIKFPEVLKEGIKGGASNIFKGEVSDVFTEKILGKTPSHSHTYNFFKEKLHYQNKVWKNSPKGSPKNRKWT